jgi:N-acetylmuramoyl-L-alanine amidase
MNYKICVDAGHGGTDPGAVGPTGLEEAGVALDLCNLVANQLDDLDIDIMLTREADVFVELEERCNIANDWEADYFVSIHLNSNGSSAVGIETLYKSDDGKDLATIIQKALINATGDTDRGIKYRDDLYVLNSTDMPAVLVEVGFISNPTYEGKFKTDEYLDLIANAIVLGICDYLPVATPKPTAPSVPTTGLVTITIDTPSNILVKVNYIDSSKK